MVNLNRVSATRFDLLNQTLIISYFRFEPKIALVLKASFWFQNLIRLSMTGLLIKDVNKSLRRKQLVVVEMVVAMVVVVVESIHFVGVVLVVVVGVGLVQLDVVGVVVVVDEQLEHANCSHRKAVSPVGNRIHLNHQTNARHQR